MKNDADGEMLTGSEATRAAVPVDVGGRQARALFYVSHTQLARD